MFNELAPGCVFMLPRGQRIFNKLVDHIKKEYRKRGFEEVQTPTLFNCDLFKTSGHYANYKDNMFILKIDDQEHSAKPMNCPGHCLLYKFRNRSYRELPIRFADFGVLHRNELKGALTGMTRVRRFQQDDAHIFCREDQIEQEITGALEFLEAVYQIFGFKFKVALSTRPEKDYLGKVETWDRAEGQLKKALDSFGKEWKVNPGDGAFYGPKIDIKLEDALKREHQCGTIQLDFQLPERFELEYTAKDDKELNRPVMIHRAIYGSLERFMAIIAEQYGGKWPFWISPRQVIIVPVSEKYLDYAGKIKKQLDQEFYVDLDESDNQIAKKVRNAQVAQYNFIFVVGAKEEENGTINLRTREDADKIHGEKTLAEMIDQFRTLTKEFK
jgi:threonyl-tRNA synthetase